MLVAVRCAEGGCGRLKDLWQVSCWSNGGVRLVEGGGESVCMGKVAD